MNSDPSEEKKALITHLEQYGRVPKSMATILINETKIISFRKRKHLVSPLDTYPNVYFILSGAVRGFAKDNGKDVTTWIATEGQIVGLTLYPRQLPTDKPQFIETLEVCQAVMIPNPLVKTLLNEFPEMGDIGRKLLLTHYREAEERNYLIRLSSAGKRLSRMMNTHPNLYHRIPLKYLASYLGMRIETLSRLRGQLLVSELDL